MTTRAAAPPHVHPAAHEAPITGGKRPDETAVGPPRPGGSITHPWRASGQGLHRTVPSAGSRVTYGLARATRGDRLAPAPQEKGDHHDEAHYRRGCDDNAGRCREEGRVVQGNDHQDARVPGKV